MRAAADVMLLSLNSRFAGGGAATGHPGRARRLAEAVFAALRLPCAARVRGPVAQLPPFAALTVVEQARRVRSRSALRARAPNPVLLGASHARRALPGCPVAETGGGGGTSNTDPVAGKAAGGAWAGRIGAAEKRRVPGRARRALRDLTRRSCLSVESAANAASSATGPGTRASQGTRSAAKGQPSEPRPGPARRLARDDTTAPAAPIAQMARLRSAVAPQLRDTVAWREDLAMREARRRWTHSRRFPAP